MDPEGMLTEEEAQQQQQLFRKSPASKPKPKEEQEDTPPVQACSASPVQEAASCTATEGRKRTMWTDDGEEDKPSERATQKQYKGYNGEGKGGSLGLAVASRKRKAGEPAAQKEPTPPAEK